MAEPDEVLQTAAAVWTGFRTRIDTRNWDGLLESDIANQLDLPEGELAELLEHHGVSIERLLRAIFVVVSPYFGMMADLLRLFEEAGVSTTGNAARMAYDFGHDEVKQLDLTRFREYQASWREVEGRARRWDNASLWALRSLLQARSERIAPSDPVSQWIRVYEAGSWPDGRPAHVRTGDATFDEGVEVCWAVWRAFVEAAEASNIPTFHRWVRDGRRTDDLRGLGPFGAEGDAWAGLMLQTLAGVRADLPSNEKAAFLLELSQLLESVSHPGSVKVGDYESLLALPIWNQRHELYSAWVLTQLVAAAPSAGWQLHHDNGRLTFSFSATKFATAAACDPPLQIWAEVRTPVDFELLGEKREHAIQPDYLICSGGGTEPGEVIAIVECKQYWQPSYKEFTAAVVDYARGHATATVILVDCGRVNREYLLKQLPDLPGPVDAVSEMTPKGSGQQTFRTMIGHVLAAHCREMAGVALPTTIEVMWALDGADVDLYLVLSGDVPQVVSYKSRGSLTAYPYAQLSADIQRAGTETITVERWPTGVHRVYVHCYKPAVDVARTGAVVRLRVPDSDDVVITCPALPGRWWHVADVSLERGVTIQGRVSNESPGLPGTR